MPDGDTDGFMASGYGSFGGVFRGIQKDGTEVAIKATLLAKHGIGLVSCVADAVLSLSGARRGR